MKTNRRITMILIYLMVITIVLFILNEIFFKWSIFQSILLNIFSGFLTSMVISVLTFNIEKEKLENNIMNQLKSYYSYLYLFYSITSLFIIGESKKVYLDKYALMKKALEKLGDRNKYYFNLDKDIIYLVDYNKEKESFYKDIDLFSNGIDLENEIASYISLYNHKVYTLKEVFNHCSEYTYNQMLKVDEIMDNLNIKFKKNINWQQIKKEEGLGFVKEKESDDEDV